MIRAEIENLLARYAWLFDADEIDGLHCCFTAGARLQIRDGAVFAGRAAVIAELRRLRDLHVHAGTVPWHVTSNVEVVAAGASAARVRSRFTLFVHRREAPPALRGLGWYDDELALEDGGWRIACRRVRSPDDL